MLKLNLFLYYRSKKNDDDLGIDQEHVIGIEIIGNGTEIVIGTEIVLIVIAIEEKENVTETEVRGKKRREAENLVTVARRERGLSAKKRRKKRRTKKEKRNEKENETERKSERRKRREKRRRRGRRKRIKTRIKKERRKTMIQVEKKERMWMIIIRVR